MGGNPGISCLPWATVSGWLPVIGGATKPACTPKFTGANRYANHQRRAYLTSNYATHGDPGTAWAV